ncbi:undecaprenyl-diphosphatase [Desulfatirhabdium butyrativorans]|uniref:undecaprenyl-diphosphatase n=1 Tax=Desulfatirhabdium butyrativorans TaxID=340467 RepID=UPI0004849994|nr:undecaprenyl-diphosphatase [Desulfatirhabdium butyrativorans]
MATSLNTAIFEWIQSGAGTHPVMDGLAVFFAEGGPFLAAIQFAAFWLFVGEKRRLALLEAIWAAAFGLLINQLISLFYYHPRPFMIGLCKPLFPHAPETSFPSDHATLLFTAAFYLLLARRWIACGAPLLLLAFLTAWGRVYSGIHFPFDIAGSMVVGLLSAGWTRLVANRLYPLNERLIRIVGPLADRWIRKNQRRAKET